jgi:50S ribosomal protein L16 3-hydroxylase
MTSPLGDLTTDQFLNEYWQKKPCLIRNAMPDFVPPIDGDDLAGLACEEYAESRIVTGSYPDHNWQVHHGPFEEDIFSDLPESRWTLLVQDVEKHYPPLMDLLRQFDFLPSWRLDDLMVSYAVTGGSVGPHVDQYDVFLYQAQGQRLWQIAEEFDATLLDDCPLNVLETFQSGQDWILKPGDMLYLPPNIAHYGVALEEGMTWSIGLRAPSAADLFVSMGEKLANAEIEARYTDPDLKSATRPGEIDQQAIKNLRELMIAELGDPAAFNEFLGTFISRFRMAQEPVSPNPCLNAAGLLKKMQSGSKLSLNPWTRLAWIEFEGDALLFAAGTLLPCSLSTAMKICSSSEPELFSNALDQRDLETVVALVNGGHLVLY